VGRSRRDGARRIYGTGDEQTIAFTAAGMEYLREMLPQYKDKRSPPQS
jgi:hypothetical protein